MKTNDYIHALYNTLRAAKGREYRAEDFKLKIGAEILRDIQPHEFMHRMATEKMYLFGIEVEIDRVNPHNLQLFEDITNKIGVPYVENGLENGLEYADKPTLNSAT